MIAAEIDWGSNPPAPLTAMQFALSGNSPVAFSQIVAVTVDNNRCGSDVSFVFPDSGYTLVVPAYNQGCYPVFTNALMFYVIGSQVSASDVTAFMVHNSMPPPVAIQPTQEQIAVGTATIPLTNGNTQVIPTGIYGTLRGGQLSLVLNLAATPSPQVATIRLVDGAGNLLWASAYSFPGSTDTTIVINLPSINLRFFNGLSLDVSGSTMVGGAVVAMLYYGQP